MGFLSPMRIASLAAVLLCGCTPPKGSWVRRDRPVAPPPPAARSAAPIPLEGGGGHAGGSGPVHVVEKGENLFRIALRYEVDLDELMDLNQISDPKNLAVGRELLLPPSRAGVRGAVAKASPPASRKEEEAPAAATAQAQPAEDEGAAASAGGRGARSQARTGLSRRPAEEGAAPSLIWPVKGVVFSRFGARGSSRHDGIDVAAPEGTTIVAAGEGEVIFSGTQRGYGNLIILRHEGGLVTIYAHNRENLVKEGARVRQGQPIAKVGRTGRATGPHLHFEVRQGTKPLNPQDFLPR